MYIIPHDINPEYQLVKSYTMQDLAFGIVWIVSQLPFLLFIHRAYRWWFIGFHVLLVLFLVTKISEIPNRKYYQGIYFWLIADRKKYSRMTSQSFITSFDKKGGEVDVVE